MSKGNAINEFKEHLEKMSKGGSLFQLIWAEVKDVDWDNKTMTATSISDGLDYFNVLLGIGSCFRYPKVGSKVILALLQGNKTKTILLVVEEMEQCLITDSTGFEWHLKSGDLTINGDQFGGIVKAPELKKQVDKNSAILDAMLQVFKTPITEPGMGAPSALNTALNSATSGKLTADLSYIENEHIKHG